MAPSATKPTLTAGDLVRWATLELTAAGADAPLLSAQVLLETATGLRRETILAFPERRFALAERERFTRMVALRCTHEPLAYILGAREFYRREFEVDRSTLIPRPETEGIVDLALLAIDERGHIDRFLDVGTGSGAIAVTLLAECPRLRAVATDVDPNALAVAQRNARRHRVATRLHLIVASLADGINVSFPLVVANLPYISTERLPTLPLDVAGFEPRAALDGGWNGVELIAGLLHALPRILAPNGLALLEIGEEQGAYLRSRSREDLPGAQVRVERDAHGDDRYLVIDRTA